MTNAPAAVRPTQRASRGASIPDGALPWLAVLAAIVVLEVVTRVDIIPQRFFAPPSVMFVALVQQFGQTGFWIAVWETMWTWAVALALAAVFAVPIGMAMGSSAHLYASLRFVVEFLRPIPSVALIPAAILVIGVNFESKILLAAFAAFWPILIQTIYGMQDVEPVAVDTARAYGAGPMTRLVFVILPSAMPYVATGMRIGSAVALIIVVTMEVVVGIRGIGLRILEARQGANVPAAYALILAAGQLGWLLNSVFAVAEKRLLHWHPSQRKAVT